MVGHGGMASSGMGALQYAMIAGGAGQYYGFFRHGGMVPHGPHGFMRAFNDMIVLRSTGFRKFLLIVICRVQDHDN